ncbi:MAG TPA: RIP metalloprotease RseP [Polyangiaceae bacterium LLY-WYZ-15_(1-7)]|nr:RIP metalloprotease RseP [Polyangiaceae bacterium LLY-WYZ-15_(1-7)]HJL09947.1 RIP metalloprotease RseP [Polyangiaceae bacterium LLY-WYZ-15_(1-7)]HJL21465.1 RIP metalloprotease RseP [Polyangiaceae bacterium LLY-WYZ-15_(1-7)]HJL36320.1 RIP metalloprotease RseP [Polyangiaceae bacterium LLY-WYZ-15_(1-7)]HJL45735.1 RIP metalloprotease RseP [Polyangiaceae bacterium LLY-WYZ-15_(1-7)]
MGPLEIVLIIVGISVLVIVHETGHYLAARAFGMRVLRYSIGFGPTLFKYKPKDSPTTFQVAAIPFLAYVQIAGMNPHEDVDPDDPELFPNKSALARIVTIAAGPFANYVAACLIAFFVGITGWPSWAESVLVEPVVVGEVSEGMPAEGVVQSGDVILAVNGEETSNFAALKEATVGHLDEITYTVERDGQVLDLAITPRPPNGWPFLAEGLDTSPVEVAEDGIFEGGPADEAGLQVGDVVVEANGTAVATLKELHDALLTNRGEASSFVVQRGDERVELSFDPGTPPGVVGVAQAHQGGAYGVGEAAKTALVYPWRLTVLQLKGIAKMFRDRDTSQLGGPVAMGKMIGAAAQNGASHYFAVLVLLSVALGMFNLLPFPALDGGRLVFLGYEVITRRRPNERFEAMVHTVGIVFLLGVIVLVTIRDIFG